MIRIERFQFITYPGTPDEVRNQVIQVCRGGGKWIQLRLKSMPEDVVLSIAGEVREVCNEYKAKLIINDYPSIAKAISADGVHLGKEDSRPSVAREMLGEHLIIGGTANTLEDIVFLASEKVDYIGLGPFRFTLTKEKLSPVLGLDGYKNILSAMKEKDVHLPVIAIGGIMAEDIPDLLATGVHGVAVSGAVATSTNPGAAMQNFISSFI